MLLLCLMGYDLARLQRQRENGEKIRHNNILLTIKFSLLTEMWSRCRNVLLVAKVTSGNFFCESYFTLQMANDNSTFVIEQYNLFHRQMLQCTQRVLLLFRGLVQVRTYLHFYRVSERTYNYILQITKHVRKWNLSAGKLLLLRRVGSSEQQ